MRRSTRPTPTPSPPSTADPTLWDPVPVTLPTYVGKAAAQRTVRTIDLDATGVWTSGRTEADSKLARDAEQTARDKKQADEAAGGPRPRGRLLTGH